jgi:hypothetical protein
MIADTKGELQKRKPFTTDDTDGADESRKRIGDP